MLATPRLAAALLCAFAAASAVQAQTRIRSVPNPVPSSAARTAQAAPNPAGLTSTFPAGINAGSGAAVSRDPIAASTSPISPGGSTSRTSALVPAELPSPDNPAVVDPAAATTVMGAAAATAVMGAGAGATVRGPGQRSGGAGGFSATDIARSFYFADANHDGELTRSEAARLSIATMPFEEMDRNFDGVISRFEYDDTVR